MNNSRIYLRLPITVPTRFRAVSHQARAGTSVKSIFKILSLAARNRQ